MYKVKVTEPDGDVEHMELYPDVLDLVDNIMFMIKAYQKGSHTKSEENARDCKDMIDEIRTRDRK